LQQHSPSSPIPPTIKLARKISTKNYRNHEQEEAISPNNGNKLIITTANEKTDHTATCSSPDEQLISDAMNSNERLDIRECSDDDNLEKLGRKVSEFFTENRLSIQSDNGNSSTVVDGGLLFNVMAARRSFISINENDEVTVISRCNNYVNGNVSVMNNYNNIQQKIMPKNANGHHYNDDDDDDDDDADDDDEYYDDSWTDEEGEDSDYNHSLRRKSFARLPIGRGGRTRKYKTQNINTQTPRRTSTTIIISDEEGNTSECSRPPSSVHSTLESNPDISKIYKQQIYKHKQSKKIKICTLHMNR